MYILRKNMRIVILSILILLCTIPVCASSAEVLESGNCGASGDNLTWILDNDGTVTISGNGAMEDYVWPYTGPWNNAAYRHDGLTIKKVVITDGVTHIGDHAFEYSSDLNTLQLADSVTSIGDYAFYSCGIEKLNLPAKLTNIGEFGFSDCNSLQAVTFPASVTVLKDGAFDDCDELKTAIFLNADTQLGDRAFKYCLNLNIYALKNGKVKAYAADEELSFCLLSEMTVKDAYITPDLGQTYATLSWTPVTAFDGYRLFRYNSSEKAYELIAEMSDCNTASYALSGLNCDTFYQYKLVAYLTINGELYNTKATYFKFRTLPDSSTIEKRNAQITNGFGASVKTVSKKYKELYGSTYSSYGMYAAEVSPISQFMDNKGNICVAYMNKAGTHVMIRGYDKNMKQVYSRKMKKLYESVGAVTCDENGCFYIVWGKSDTDQKDGTTTLAVSKYKKNGTLVKTYKHKQDEYGSNIKEAFRSGNCDVVIQDGVLYVNFSKGMYNGHQANGILVLDTKTMNAMDLYNNYVSHSFDQRVLVDKDGIAWFANHGDAFPRGFQVATSSVKENTKYDLFHFYADESALDNMFVLNQTRAKMGGVIETSSGLVFVGSSVKALNASGYNSQEKNLFIKYVDSSKTMSDTASRSGECLGESVKDNGIKWLTSYKNYSVENPQVIYTADDRIVILWEQVKNHRWNGTYYMILSSNGEVLQKATKMKGVRLNANEEPIYKDGNIYWATSGEDGRQSNKLKLHRLNLSALAFDDSTLKVKKLKVTDKTKTAVTLKWNKNNKADGYCIYKYNASKKKYIEVKTVKASTLKYTVKELKKGTKYKFAVKAYKQVNGKTYWSEYTKITVKTKR